jgi:hypothetical protein
MTSISKSLKVEIIEIYQLAIDQDGTMLVWTEDASSGVARAIGVRAVQG